MERNLDLKLLLQIFLTFLRISPTSFGGGYAMIPLIEQEIVERRKWMKPKEMTDVFVIAQAAPGAIAINSAIFTGYRMAGYLGAIVATIGVLLPTFIIVIVLSFVYLQVHDNPKVAAAFISIRATIVALIIYAGYKIGKTAVVDRTTFCLIFLTIALMCLTSIHPVVVILGGGLVGIVIVYIRKKIGMYTKMSIEEQHNNYQDYFMGGGI
ncbi:MAG: chromate transporter [Paenibacillaceae bacterium]